MYFSNASHYDIQERLKLSGPTVRLDVIAQSHLTEQSHDLPLANGSNLSPLYSITEPCTAFSAALLISPHLQIPSSVVSTTLCTRCGMLCSVPSDYQLVLFVVLEKNLSIFLITFCKAFGPKNKANETMC